MQARIRYVAARLLLLVCSTILVSCLPSSPPSEAIAPTGCDQPAEPPLSVIHFFDWYGQTGDGNGPINGPKWTHTVDWASYGLAPEEVGTSRRYFDQQLDMIEELGVDGIVYQFYREADGSIGQRLSPQFLESLSAHQLRIGLFYDWEIQNVAGLPVLSRDGYISPRTETAQFLIDGVASFYERVPRDRWLIDRQGRLVIMVYGFGFDRAATDAQAWNAFYQSILNQTEQRLGVRPIFYWSAINRLQQEYAFQHFPDQIRPFNFVLDIPQPQLAPGAVTWNVNFDNLGVQRHHRLPRVIRDDPRYLEEMLWLAKRTTPDLLYIYGWNEYFEGANVMPDETYGTTRYDLVKALLRDVRDNSAQTLPCTLLIVDDYAEVWQSNDWHLQVEEQFTLYPLRRLIPQADVRLARDVTPELLDRYDLIVMLAQRSPDTIALIEPLIDRKQVVLIGPPAGYAAAVRDRFVASIEYVSRNRDVRLVDASGADQGQIFVRDDVFNVTPARGVEIAAQIADSQITPVLLRHDDDWWLNAFVPDDRLLAPLFARVYARSLEPGIMYGEGTDSQLTEVLPDGTVNRKIFSAPAAFVHEPLPVPWNPPPPPELPASARETPTP